MEFDEVTNGRPRGTGQRDLATPAQRIAGGTQSRYAPAGPDFAALFPVQSCALDHADAEDEDGCVVCRTWQLTPRTADLLHAALEGLLDRAHDEVNEKGGEPVSRAGGGEWPLFGSLPRVTWGMDSAWRRQFGRACEDLARDLAAGQWPRPRCTAEEMALQLAVRVAAGCQEAWQENSHHTALPRHPGDYDWPTCSETLFEDDDVLMLYDQGLDGSEDPAGPLNQEYGAANLHPAAWFKFFAHHEPREPSRPFRR